jgi:hypothetical protein
MGEVVYVSEVHIERKPRSVRLAWLPGEKEPILFGVHGAIAKHYGRDSNTIEPHAATLDYLVAAAGG